MRRTPTLKQARFRNEGIVASAGVVRLSFLLLPARQDSPSMLLPLVALLFVPVASPPVSFKQDIEPLLTRAGCNAGACHGTPQGKNGFRLSLRGYDPAIDY